MPHEKYMQRCLQLAAKGIRNAAPNPSVGAILVYHDTIIGEGATSPFGGPHAEVNCINSVAPENKNKITEATFYVSLEPCSHFGKTPPCANLIIANKIKKVVIGSTDPNPLVQGKGIEMLKNAEIEVIEHVLEKECIELNKRFYTFHTQKRPYIILKWAQSHDGYFAPLLPSKLWLTNEAAKTLVHQWRSEETAIMVGSNTALIDNPLLTVRNVTGKNPMRILIDRNLKTPLSYHIYNNEAPTVVFTESKTYENTENVKFVSIDFNGNWPAKICEILFTLHIQSVLIEGGAVVLNSFIDNHLWDEARILTGNKNLQNGIPAPTVKGKEEFNFNISDNNCKIIRNLQA
jgi:diaminohydroxyphosphoribosylaminopyrimidine deaminase / 5-amino-6-(5-phosphoribosylamino)uracil reductase